MKLSASHSKNLALLLTLYLAQGLPAGFITQALPAILRQYQVSLVAIGWSGLILAPWAIKFLWATVVDSHYNERMGRSRTWILPLQLLSCVLLIAIALFDPNQLSQSTSVFCLYVLLFCLSMIGATHDIATDGLATRLLKPHFSQNSLSDNTDNNPQHFQQQNQHQQSQGNAIQVIGYRLGLILGGGVLLMSLENLGWRYSFLAMAMLIFVNTLPIIFYQEPTFVRAHLVKKDNPQKSDNFSQKTLTYIKKHYQYFWQTPEMLAWLAVLLSFKLADGLSSGMVKPMMVDLGIGLEKIGFWATILGSGASLFGAWVATLFLKKISCFVALIVFSTLQALTTGLYGVVFYGFEHQRLHSFGWVYAVNALEHFCSALALIAMMTTIMHYARHEQAGSDYTFQMCLLTVVSGSLHFVSGYSVDIWGYTTHFFVSMALGTISLFTIIYWQKSLCIEK